MQVAYGINNIYKYPEGILTFCFLNFALCSNPLTYFNQTDII